MLLLLFMAVTSSTPAELIAVSSLLTFDVYKTYVRPKATSTELVRISHYGIILFSLVLAAFCCILNAASIKLTWLFDRVGYNRRRHRHTCWFDLVMEQDEHSCGVVQSVDWIWVRTHCLVRRNTPQKVELSTLKIQAMRRMHCWECHELGDGLPLCGGPFFGLPWEIRSRRRR
jgi:hypothetical protein